MDRVPIEAQDGYTKKGSFYGFEDRGNAFPECYYEKVLKPFAEKILSVSSDCLVLDLACGTGEAADFLESSGLNVIRMDISEIALGKNPTASRRLRCRAEEIPLRPGCLAGIHMKDALVHIANKVQLVQEFNRILNGDGIVSITSAEESISFISYQFTGSQFVNVYSIRENQTWEEALIEVNSFEGLAKIGPLHFKVSDDEFAEIVSNNGLSVESLDFTFFSEDDWYHSRRDRFVATLRKK